MTENLPIHDFRQVLDCVYRDELYSARDNGAVLRHSRAGKRLRPNDDQWTFGNPNDSTGYMDITYVTVHRIIATAFHGEPPTKGHVVDHIDTNKRNNRPENLRWVTRLENILLNPITARRIAKICGSIEDFLADPSKFRDMFPDPNFNWMGTVSVEEAQKSLSRMLVWAQNEEHRPNGFLEEWIANRNIPRKQMFEAISEIPEIIMAKTPNAAQREWRTPSEFPCCPIEYTGEPIQAYAEHLKTGAIFCHNEIYSSFVLKSAISDEGKSLYVISENKEEIKPWGLAKITYENDLFVHTSLHKFFTSEGAEKQFTLSQGLEWTGGDTIDDYC